MTLSKKLIEEIKGLRGRGQGYKAIARQKKISPSTTHKYCKSITLSREAKRKIEKVQIKARNNFSRQFAKEKEIKHPSLNEEVASILGHLFFDGSIPVARNGKYRINYTNASESAVNSFVSKVQKNYGLIPSKIQMFNGKGIPWFMVEFYSKKLYFDLMSFSNSFSTRNGVSIPPKLKHAGRAIQIAFLRAFWDDEGAICANGHLVGTSKSEKMIDELIAIHASFGVKTTKTFNKSSACFLINVSSKLENQLKFQENIGFVHGKITKGHNKGLLKRSVLGETINKKLIKANLPIN